MNSENSTQNSCAVTMTMTKTRDEGAINLAVGILTNR
jgi:hypothetical protein